MLVRLQSMVLHLMKTALIDFTGLWKKPWNWEEGVVRVGLRIVGGETQDLCDQNTLHACMKISKNELTTSDFIPNNFKIMNTFKIITPRRIHWNKMLGHQTSFHLFQNISVSQRTTGSNANVKWEAKARHLNVEIKKNRKKIWISHMALNRCIWVWTICFCDLLETWRPL